MSTVSRVSAALLTGLLAIGFSGHAAAIQVKGEPVKASTKAAAPLAWRADAFPTAGVAKIGFKELAPERIAKLQRANDDDSKIKAVQIGIGRNLSSDGVQTTMPALRWQVLASGAKVARIEVTSPDAFGLRVGVKAKGLMPGAEVRFAGSDNARQVIAMATADQVNNLVDDKSVYWTPGTDGQTQIIEIYLPKGVLAAPVRLQVISVSHLMINSKEDMTSTKLSGSCNVNVACSTATLGQNFINAKNAVAHIRFVAPDPNNPGSNGTFICTGTLLNDTVAATQIPYFFTANHCIENQTLANTINFYFNYETATCGNINTTATFPAPVSGGATLLYTDADTSTTATANGTDTTLLRMNSAPPANAFFAGWDSAALATGTNVTAIHHPDGDPKKVSQGQKKTQSAKLHTAGWTSGTTEGGSSGSGLFTIGAGGEYFLRGGLYRGGAACSNSGNINNANNNDDYSRLDVAFPSVQQFLAPASTNGPTVDHSGPWYNVNESGWGLTWNEYPNNGFLGLMFIYDTSGRADWYELAGTWTGNDVHSGNVLRDSGPAFGNSFNSAQVSKTVVGTYTLTFTSATTATYTFTINGVTRTGVVLTKLANGAIARTSPYYNLNESGWGLTWFEYPNNGYLGLMFIYDTNGRADWYELGGTLSSANVHSGNLLRVSGPAFGTTFNSAQVSKATVGTYTLTFTSATTATYSFTIGGVTRTGIVFNKL
jgi:lysyl endopeptidase